MKCVKGIRQLHKRGLQYRCSQVEHLFLHHRTRARRSCQTGTEGAGGSYETIRELCPGAELKKGMDLKSEAVLTAETVVNSWIDQESRKAEENMQIRIQSGDDKVLIFQLNESRAARALYEQLPLMVELENYSTNEKIFYPPTPLDTADTPLADGGIGTLAYYAPWGDVVIFYGSYRSNSQLYELGNVISGGDLMRTPSGNVHITKEK